MKTPIIRYKTEEEFIQEFGPRWRAKLPNFSFVPSMNDFLGQVVDFNNSDLNMFHSEIRTSSVSQQHILQSLKKPLCEEIVFFSHKGYYITNYMLVAIPWKPGKPIYKKKLIL